jgi:5-formyltetrahydrofolate cyclo-ligase
MDTIRDTIIEGTETEYGLKKNRIRTEILKKRSELSLEERTRASLLITDRIVGHQWFYNSDKILVFIGYGSEIETYEIIREALRLGKKVYVPKVKGRNMDFYRIKEYDELEAGFKGIPEPAGTSEKYDFYRENEAMLDRTLIIMPGVVFDKENNRIGYGKGYYDRFLEDKEELRLRSIAIGFKCQMLEEERIPAMEHDLKPYQVICV